MTDLDYWKECISEAADGCGLILSPDQLQQLAEGVSISHEHYGMAFYSPPASDRLSTIENEWKAKYGALEKEFERYREGAESAVRTALKQHTDANISIANDGTVYRHGGRTEVIQ